MTTAIRPGVRQASQGRPGQAQGLHFSAVSSQFFRSFHPTAVSTVASRAMLVGSGTEGPWRLRSAQGEARNQSSASFGDQRIDSHRGVGPVQPVRLVPLSRGACRRHGSARRRSTHRLGVAQALTPIHPDIFCRTISQINSLLATLPNKVSPTSCNVAVGEPNYLSPNQASPVVDGIVPFAPAIASPDIPNSAIHFRTISFSSSGRGEPLCLAQCVRCGSPPPNFSVSPENAHLRLTRRASRFTLFGLLAYVYSGGCFALSGSHSTAERPRRGLSLWCQSTAR